MKGSGFGILCLCAVLMTISPASAGRADSDSLRILLLGDSILDCLKGEHRVEHRLWTKLEARGIRKAVVWNKARGGMWIGPAGTDGIEGISEPLFQSTEAGWYDRVREACPMADAVVVLFGTNDSKVYSPEVFGQKLAALCDRLEQDYSGVRIVLATGMYVDPAHSVGYGRKVSHVTGFVQGASRNAYLKPYFDQTRRIAQERGYGLADVCSRVQTETETGNWDLRVRLDGSFDASKDGEHPDNISWYNNIHPNPQGVEIIADVVASALISDPPPFADQVWVRDRTEPCIALGEPGAFDDTHLFAPCVVYVNGVYSMYYSGSQGTVAERVFALGLASSPDGVHFTRDSRSPVLRFGESQSILTPTLLRNPDGSVLREEGRLRMWFSSTDFPSGDGRHTLHETTSANGIAWTTPSDPQVVNAYAPTIIREEGVYRMWYSDVSDTPWTVRYAESSDGRRWTLDPQPVLVLDQSWERSRLFYPTVLKHETRYLMWYGSYLGSSQDVDRTSLGFAVSKDGRHWEKHPGNPVFGPEASNAWESHYTTSQSVVRLPDGSWRIWYASRPKPPFVHKYFAIGTAHWSPEQ